MNIEVKNEVGSGGAAIHVQNAAYAAKYAGGQAGVLRQSSTCPTRLIELAGPHMSLSACIQQCGTPWYHLLWQHSPLMLQAALMFCGIKDGLA